jgi:hypothetical protein
MMFDSGGGEGWKCVLFGSKNEEDGIGRDIINPKNEILAIHFEDKRGSSVKAALAQ